MITVGVNGHVGTISVTSNLKFAQGFLAVADIVRRCIYTAEGPLINLSM